MISNFPKIRLLFVRLSISGLRIAGIDVFERIPWSIVVSLVEIILFCRGDVVWCGDVAVRCITVNV